MGFGNSHFCPCLAFISLCIWIQCFSSIINYSPETVFKAFLPEKKYFPEVFCPYQNTLQVFLSQFSFSSIFYFMVLKFLLSFPFPWLSSLQNFTPGYPQQSVLLTRVFLKHGFYDDTLLQKRQNKVLIGNWSVFHTLVFKTSNNSLQSVLPVLLLIICYQDPICSSIYIHHAYLCLWTLRHTAPSTWKAPSFPFVKQNSILHTCPS